MNNRSIVEIITEWDIVAARQLGRNEAKKVGFNTVDQARITTVISELARNIYLYARAGEICIEHVENDGKLGVRIIAVDKGPGISDVRKVMEDGYSTSGSLGAGLPGVKRLMDTMEVYSIVDEGTTVIVEKWI